MRISASIRWTRSSTYRIYSICGGDDARVEKKSKEFNSHIHPEKHDDFLPSHCRVFTPDVQDHDRGHDDGDDVDETRCLRGTSASFSCKFDDTECRGDKR